MIFSKGRNWSSHGDGRFELNHFSEIGENVIIESDVLVFHPENIIIKSNVYIGHKTILKAYYRNELIVEEGTWIGQNCFFHSAGGIIIGKAVGIGPYVKILTSSHESDDDDLPVLHNPLVYNQVIIKDGSDIGIGSIILPGVTIGEGSIIGAGSVVTKDVPDYTIFAGNPSRLLRKRSRR